MSKTVLVLGMHRSGTSAIAGMLHHGGISMGSRLLGADRANKKGYYEDMALLNLNKSILNINNVNWKTITDNTFINKTEPFIENNMRNLIKLYNSLSPFWGWKEPRMSITYPLWHKHFFNNQIFIIYSIRDPNAIAQSLYRRNRIYPDDSTKLISAYNNHIKRNVSELRLRCLEIKYEDLIENTQKNIESIESFLDIKLNPNAYSFIDKEMNHYETPHSFPI